MGNLLPIIENGGEEKKNEEQKSESITTPTLTERAKEALWASIISSVDGIAGYTTLAGRFNNPYGPIAIGLSSVSGVTSFLFSLYFQIDYAPSEANKLQLNDAAIEVLNRNFESLFTSIARLENLSGQITEEDLSQLTLDNVSREGLPIFLQQDLRLKSFPRYKRSPYNNFCNFLQITTDTLTGFCAGLSLNTFLEISSPLNGVTAVNAIAPIIFGGFSGVSCYLFHLKTFSFAHRVSISIALWEKDEIEKHLRRLQKKISRLENILQSQSLFMQRHSSKRILPSQLAQPIGENNLLSLTQMATVSLPIEEMNSLLHKPSVIERTQTKTGIGTYCTGFLALIVTLLKSATYAILGMESMKQDPKSGLTTNIMLTYVLMVTALLFLRLVKYQTLNNSLRKFGKFAQAAEETFIDEEKRIKDIQDKIKHTDGTLIDNWRAAHGEELKNDRPESYQVPHTEYYQFVLDLLSPDAEIPDSIHPQIIRMRKEINPLDRNLKSIQDYLENHFEDVDVIIHAFYSNPISAVLRAT